MEREEEDIWLNRLLSAEASDPLAEICHALFSICTNIPSLRPPLCSPWLTAFFFLFLLMACSSSLFLSHCSTCTRPLLNTYLSDPPLLSQGRGHRKLNPSG